MSGRDSARHDANIKLMSAVIHLSELPSTSDDTDSLRTQNCNVLKETIDGHISTILGI